VAEVVVVVVMVVVVVDQVVYGGPAPACMALPSPGALAVQGTAGVHLLAPAALPAGVQTQATTFNLTEDVTHILEQFLIAAARL
jgi:membrane protein DedA with SNARE-associated domain